MTDTAQPRSHPSEPHNGARRTITILAVVFTVVILALVGVIIGLRNQAVEELPSRDDAMRTKMLELRSMIDREGTAQWFLYPAQDDVRPGGTLGDGEWPTDPWTGEPLSPGSERGHYVYLPTKDRRSYRLVGYLSSGKIEMSGAMPRSIMLAYDHRSEEGINLIRQYIEAWAREHGGVCPEPSEVAHDGEVGHNGKLHWPSNPWDHKDMERRGDRGSFAYSVSADRRAYTLTLHRALKKDYVLRGPLATP